MERKKKLSSTALRIGLVYVALLFHFPLLNMANRAEMSLLGMPVFYTYIFFLWVVVVCVLFFFQSQWNSGKSSEL